MRREIPHKFSFGFQLRAVLCTIIYQLPECNIVALNRPLAASHNTSQSGRKKTFMTLKVL